MRISDWSSDVCSSDLHHCANPWTPDKRFFRLSASSARGHIGFPAWQMPSWHRGISQRFPCCRSEEHTSELQTLMRNSYAVFCLKKKKINTFKYISYLLMQVTLQYIQHEIELCD